MLSLSLFSSSQSVSVSVCVKKKIKTFYEIQNQSMKSDVIMHLLSKVFQTYNNDFEYIIIPRGPGGFTSIRNLLSISQGLSLTNGAKIRTVSTFEIFLPYFRRKKKKIVIIFKDSRKDFFYQFYSNNNDKWQKESKIFSGFSDEIEKKIEQYSKRNKSIEIQIVTNENEDIFSKGYKKKVYKFNIDARYVMKAHFLGFSKPTTKLLYFHPHYGKKI